MLTVKKILAGRRAVDFYLNQTRRGLGDYYLPEGSAAQPDGAGLSAPGSAWWGGGAEVLALSGEVGRAEFEPLYSTAAHRDGGYLGRRFRLHEDEEAAAAKADALLEASEITDPYERWMARHEVRRRAPQASVAAWDCTFSPPKSVSLLWAAGDRELQRLVWAAHLAAVDAGLGYLEEHAGIDEVPHPASPSVAVADGSNPGEPSDEPTTAATARRAFRWRPRRSSLRRGGRRGGRRRRCRAGRLRHQ